MQHGTHSPTPRTPIQGYTLWAVLLLLCCAGASRAQYGIAWPDGRLEIEGRLRLGWHHRWLFPDEPEPDLNKNRFYVQQARLKFSGWQYDSRIRWEMQFELRGYNGLEREAGHENDYQGLQAKDMHISWVPSDLLTVRLGQFKVPYGRKQLIPLHDQSMVKRADLVDGFLPGRDRGLMVRGRSGDRHLTGWVGVFTGNGENKEYNDSEGGYLYVARLQWQPLGDAGDEEGDYGRTSRPKLVLGSNVASSNDRMATGEEALEYKRTIDGEKLLYGGDASFKWAGWFLTAEFDHARFEPETGRTYKTGGWLVQAGHAIPLERLGLEGWLLEPVASYDEYNPSSRTADDTQRTITAGLNLLPDGHDLKIMLNGYHRLKLKDGDANPWKEDEVRAIVQLRIQ